MDKTFALYTICVYNFGFPINKSTIIVTNIQSIPLKFQNRCDTIWDVAKDVLLEGAATMLGNHIFFLSKRGYLLCRLIL